MRSKYFLKKNKKNLKENKSYILNYNIPVTTSLYNSTIFQKHEKLISKKKKKSLNHNKNITYNKRNEKNYLYNIGCKEKYSCENENNEIKDDNSLNFICELYNFRKENNKKGIKTIKKKGSNLNEKENLHLKYEQIILINREFNNLMKNLKLNNKELSRNVKCEKCNCGTILKKGKYGYFLVCKSCFVKISKKNIDNFIYNEKGKAFYKNKRKISFEIENKYSFRIHYFGNINVARKFNQIISEIIKEIVVDLIRIKKNKIKYRNIIKYIYKINNPFNENNNYFNNFFFLFKKRNYYFYNFSFKRNYYANVWKKNNYIKRKTKYDFLFLYNKKFIHSIETKININKKYKNRIKKCLLKYLNNDFFQEIFYLPLSWKPRKDYINSGIFPFHLSKDIKKIKSFRRLSVNNNNYLCGCVFIMFISLILRYFIYKLYNSHFIYEIPKTIYYFFRHFYPKFNNKFYVFKHFLKKKYIDTVIKTYEKYKSSLIEIKKNYIIHKYKQLEEESKEERSIMSSYNFEELYISTYLIDKCELRKEILSNYYMRKKNKIKKKINKEIKSICLEEIKKKLPRRIQKVILPYQLETIYFFKKKNGRILIADEMGLGKTLQSISILYFYNLMPTLIISPSSLKINWLSEIEKFLNFFDISKILIINSSNDLPKLNINYKEEIFSYNKNVNIIKEIKFKLIIVDESHFIRTVHYGKQSELTKMIKKKIKETKNVIFLSGTPSINRPINIFHQIKFLINNNKIFCKNKFIFGEEFCKKYYYRGERIYEENLRSWEFYIFLKKTVMIRRIISNIFKNNFPNLKRFFIYLPTNIHDTLSEKNFFIKGKNREDKNTNNEKSIKKNLISEKDVINNLKNENREVEKNRILYDKEKDRAKLNRQKLNKFFNIDIKSKKEEEGLSKVVNALHCIEKYFPEKKKIIFCYHLVVCKCIEEELLKIIKKKKEKNEHSIDYIVLNGCLREKEKIEKIKYFQANSNCYYGIFTICSVSHGLDFSFCNLCFFIELPVNFFHLQQCESRLFRKNQKFNTFVFYFLLQYGLGSDYKTWKRFLLCSQSTRSITDGIICDNKDLFYENFSNDVIDLINNNCINKKEDKKNEATNSSDSYNKEMKLENKSYKENEFYNNENSEIKNGSKEMNENIIYYENDECYNKENINSDNKNYKKKKKKKKRYLFEMNTLTNRIHAYNKNRKTNFTIEELNNLKSKKKQTLKKCASKFLENYNKLKANEKRWIEKKKCDVNISLLKYLNNGNQNMQLKFQRYIKNIALKNKTYVKAYIEYSFKGKFQISYYQEYDEESNTLKCLYCNNTLPFSEGILDEENILHYLKENSHIETVERFKKELEMIKLKKSNIKKIIICKENNLFCEGNCRKEYFLKKNSYSLRRLIFERDKGICNICNLNCTDLIKQIKKTKYFSINERIDYFIKTNPLFIENINHLKKILEKPRDGYIWQVDHILPVFKGGGEASFDNLQTLCTFCHQKKTKNDVKNKKDYIFNEKKSKYF
ncbi:LOW QUALITY PROTEIN: DNA helicase, putative [Plasmodium relictum]|uniref:DNA helicase, putative n=1 Tax=Plasmodium relictum TaxID=85471 RepID=A0A1J1H804_PLARL|nr:LOW QUALITY PROTEIN: DNA helicase, putative [Plasmodium relictum]CRH01088.1 DNA helicase, putative [Plasmodium relictum]